MQKKMKIAAAVLIVLAYTVFAALWIYIFYTGPELLGASLTQEQSERLKLRGNLLMASEGLIYLVFLLESWYVFFREKNRKAFVTEMAKWMLLVLFMGAVGAVVCRIFLGEACMNFFEPFFMMIWIFLINLIISQCLFTMDKVSAKRKSRFR